MCLRYWPSLGRNFGAATAAAAMVGAFGGTAWSYGPIPSFSVNGPDRAMVRPGATRGALVRVQSAEGLSDVFDRAGYRLDGVRRHGEVPRLFLVSLPRDLREIRVPSHRKIMFIKTALPLILLVNERIERDRMRIQILRTLIATGAEVPVEDLTWLMGIAERYGLERLDFDELLRRVDVIPPSLALAQGAEETGWGTSRFAHEGNALFGQRVYGDKGGLLPHRRDKGKRFLVRAFEDLIEGVRAYAYNLNTFVAYADFRRVRAAVRRAGRPLTGIRLVETLENYSERREGYIDTLQAIIRTNALQHFDGARLGHDYPGPLYSPDT